MWAGLAFGRSDRGTILPSIGSGIVLTRRVRPLRREVQSTQTLGAGLRALGERPHSNYVIHCLPKAIEPTPPRSRQKRRKVRGRKPCRYLTWAEVTQVHEIDHALVTMGYDRAFFVTIRSEGETDRDRKDFIQRKRGHICQSIQRSGLPFLAQTGFEKPIGGQLHAHMLVYGDKKRLKPILARHGELDERQGAQKQEMGVQIHIRWAVDADPAYMTKQRRYDHPDIEAHRFHRRVKGASIPGRLLVYPPRDVRQVMADWQELKAPPASKVEGSSAGSIPTERTRRIQTPPMVPVIEEAGGQLGFVLGSPINLVARLDELRKARGARQEDIAAAIGISRPTFANALGGRYRLSDWAISRAAELLKAAA